jgi:hypothetical protein
MRLERRSASCDFGALVAMLASVNRSYTNGLRRRCPCVIHKAAVGALDVHHAHIPYQCAHVLCEISRVAHLKRHAQRSFVVAAPQMGTIHGWRLTASVLLSAQKCRPTGQHTRQWPDCIIAIRACNNGGCA